jgi:hypothetical protein
MKMFVDPVTGEMRDPTPAERAAMAKQESSLKATEPTKSRVVKLRNGGTAIMIDAPPHPPMKACEGADGSVAIGHDCETKEESKQNPEGDKP